MIAGRRHRENIIILFVAGLLALNYPLLSIFEVGQLVLGIPLLYLYVYLVWLVIIVVMAIVVARSELRAGERSDSRDV